MFSPSTWPSDSSALARFGSSEIRVLATHFENPLNSRHYDPEVCVDEWAELKLRIQELQKVDPTTKGGS